MEGQGGARDFLKWKNLSRMIFWESLGGNGLPKGLLGTIQSNPLAQIPLKPYGGPISFTKSCFRGLLLQVKKVPSRARAFQDPNLVSGTQELVPGAEHRKVARQRTMQNPVVGIQNGAICCKLWLKTMAEHLGWNCVSPWANFGWPWRPFGISGVNFD